MHLKDLIKTKLDASFLVPLKKTCVARPTGQLIVRVNGPLPFATTIKNIMSVVYSECILNVGDSDQISVFLAADILTM